MKSYIGTKIILAMPMDESTFLIRKRKVVPSCSKSRPGYLVMYPDGYESWSPKDTFEHAYRELSVEEKELIS